MTSNEVKVLSTLWILGRLLLIQTVDQVAKENPVIDDNSIHLQDDILDASDLMALIHAPTAEVSYIHSLAIVLKNNERYPQVMNIFNSYTEYCNSGMTAGSAVSFAPRSPNGQVDISNSLMNLRQLNPVDFTDLLRKQGIVVPPSSSVTCDPSAAAYRTMDGSCNNLEHPCWGKAEEPYQRWLPPDYGNGIDEPRRTDGLPLPSPRFIYRWVSSEFEPSPETQTSSFTTLLVTFGQFIAFDMILTPMAKVTSKIWDGQKFVDKKVKCCNTSSVQPDCFPIFISQSDSYYPPGHCMEFVRSAAHAHRPSGCYPPALGQRREQMNELTAFIDASVVYGASETEMRNLREHNGRGAKLSMSNIHGVQYPPRKLNSTCRSSREVCDKRCHMLGDKRANEIPALAAFHTVFARHHNTLVDFLRIKGWDEETLFQVVRKIVGAQLQHIVYHEYLPAIIGRRTDQVDDVDLYVAGVSEKPVNDGILGPTFTCIVANQFRNLKFGDRFWYENLNHPGAFTKAQIAEIRKTTLSSIICANSDLEEIQLSAFLVEGLGNQKFRCEDIVRTQSMNLNVWE